MQIFAKLLPLYYTSHAIYGESGMDGKRIAYEDQKKPNVAVFTVVISSSLGFGEVASLRVL